MTDILQLNGVCKAFGQVIVANDTSFSLAQGEALGIIGPNGAGKTSLFNLITGNLQLDAGEIFFAGQDISHLSAGERCQAGLARSYQVPQPFTDMSVYENLLVAATYGAQLSGQAAQDHCLAVLADTELLPKANVLAGSLTLLERKRLEMARALAAKPKLILLDEIAGGLTEPECQSLIETIKAVHATGVSIIWIEHVVHALLAVVSRLMVVDFGKQVAIGEPMEVMDSDLVKEIYLGVDPHA